MIGYASPYPLDHWEQLMQLDITGHQIDLTDALQQHVRGKMRKLERHSDEITHMHVVLNG